VFCRGNRTHLLSADMVGTEQLICYKGWESTPGFKIEMTEKVHLKGLTGTQVGVRGGRSRTDLTDAQVRVNFHPTAPRKKKGSAG